MTQCWIQNEEEFERSKDWCRVIWCNNAGCSTSFISQFGCSCIWENGKRSCSWRRASKHLRKWEIKVHIIHRHFSSCTTQIRNICKKICFWHLDTHGHNRCDRCSNKPTSLRRVILPVPIHKDDSGILKTLTWAFSQKYIANICERKMTWLQFLWRAHRQRLAGGGGSDIWIFWYLRNWPYCDFFDRQRIVGGGGF